MMKTRIKQRILLPLAVLHLAVLLTACDSSPPPQPQTERAPNPAFETQIQALEKARAVEGQVLDAAEAQKQQIDQAAQ